MFVRWLKTKLARAGKRWARDGKAYEVGCHHPHGDTSVRLTPVVLESYRDVDGKPKHRRIWSPGEGVSIRQCCVDDRETFERVQFWRNLEATIDEAISSHPRGDDLLFNRALILWAVSKVVPKPSVDEVIMFEFIRHRIPIPYPQGLNELEKERFEYRECAKAHADWTNNRRNGEGFGAYRQRKALKLRRLRARRRSQKITTRDT